MRTSKTLDSLAELAPKAINTPSTSSSGYGSQAVSSTNLSSTDDSTSLRSISVDETPDFDSKPSIITDSAVSISRKQKTQISVLVLTESGKFGRDYHKWFEQTTNG